MNVLKTTVAKIEDTWSVSGKSIRSDGRRNFLVGMMNYELT